MIYVPVIFPVKTNPSDKDQRFFLSRSGLESGSRHKGVARLLRWLVVAFSIEWIMYIYIYVYIYICIYINDYMYVYIYICIHTYWLMVRNIIWYDMLYIALLHVCLIHDLYVSISWFDHCRMSDVILRCCDDSILRHVTWVEIQIPWLKLGKKGETGKKRGNQS